MVVFKNKMDYVEEDARLLDARLSSVEWLGGASFGRLLVQVGIEKAADGYRAVTYYNDSDSRHLAPQLGETVSREIAEERCYRLLDEWLEV